MSLLRRVLSDWWEDLNHPHGVFDQDFGMSLTSEDLDRIAPSPDQLLIYRPRRSLCRKSRYRPYINPRLERSISTLQADKDKFKVTLDIQHFAPDEVNVKVVDKNIIVEADHEEKEDEHGWISRRFMRKYLIPSQCDPDKVESHLSSDGVLTITAPRKQAEIESNERPVQINFTGQPAVKEVAQANELAEITDNQDQELDQKQKNPNIQNKRKRATMKA